MANRSAISAFLLCGTALVCKGQSADTPVSLKDTASYVLHKIRYGLDGLRSEQWVLKKDTTRYYIKRWKKDKLNSIGFYHNRKRNGPFVLYNDDGSLQSEGYYQDGRMNGAFRYYDTGGIRVITYRNDSLIKELATPPKQAPQPR